MRRISEEVPTLLRGREVELWLDSDQATKRVSLWLDEKVSAVILQGAKGELQFPLQSVKLVADTQASLDIPSIVQNMKMTGLLAKDELLQKLNVIEVSEAGLSFSSILSH